MITKTELDLVAKKHNDSPITRFDIEAIVIPNWPNGARAFPNAFLRSALFTVSSSRGAHTPRRYSDKEQLACPDGMTVEYTGFELRQDDADVLMQVMHMARNQPPEAEIRFSAFSMLQALGCGGNSRDYDHLRDCFRRLKATALAVTVDHHVKGANGKTTKRKVTFTGSLVGDFITHNADTNERLEQWVVELPKTMIRLFEPELYSLINWNAHKELSPLGKALHHYFSSHRTPFPIKVETLHTLKRSQTKLMRRFRADLNESLEKLVEINFLKKFDIDPKTNLVSVERKFDRTTLE